MRELTRIFTSPEQFNIKIKSSKLSIIPGSRGVTMERSNDLVTFVAKQSGGGSTTITLPTSIDMLEWCRVVELHSRRLRSSVVGGYTVECLSISPLDNPTQITLADAVVQHIPRGVTLDRWHPEDTQSIYSAISLLERTLHQESLYFKRLSPASIIVDEAGRLYPIDYSNLRFGYSAQTPSPCETLRHWVDQQYHTVEQLHTTPLEEYPASSYDRDRGFLYAADPNEERVLVEDLSGWGVVDDSGRVIVEPHYRKILQFCEGRAVVLSDAGWGLIDLEGVEVIPSCYESISYNAASGICALRRGGLWGYFSYLGEQLTPFCEGYPDEDISVERVLSQSESKPSK